MNEPAKWHTHTPQSLQERFAELHLMRELRRLASWHLADDAWQAALMPVGCLVTQKSSGQHYFVVRAYDAAMLAWPAVSPQVNLWEMDKSATSLSWVVVLDLNDWSEVPLKYASPLQVFISDIYA